MQARTEQEAVTELLAKANCNGGCLECHLAPVLRGYCYTSLGREVKWRVNRLVWHVIRGPIPEGLLVLHSCDNRICINIEHLFLGTEADNTRDMMEKGRGRTDPEAAMRRRERTAKSILPLYQQGLDRHAIARKLFISASTVWNYTNGPYRDYFMFLARDTDSICI